MCIVLIQIVYIDYRFYQDSIFDQSKKISLGYHNSSYTAQIKL